MDATRSNGAGDRAVRLVQVDRRQLCWAMLDVERLIEDDHPARAIWELTGRLDLVGFSMDIRSVEGGAGRPAYDPAPADQLVGLRLQPRHWLGARGGAQLASTTRPSAG